jgi:hypothetical protein|nr:MAG TPA: tail protein [Caudoviricetes sp.]
MEILQSKIYGKNDNFNLEEGKSYSSLKSSFIIKQINDKVGKIYITDSLGYCIKIFDIELNDEIKSLSRNLEEYKLKVTELLTDQKTSLTQLINNKSVDVEGIKTSTNELKESVKDIKKKLPKKIIWEDSKIKIKLNDDNFLETEQINIVTENTKIKSFKYEAGVFKITDTNDTVFPSNVDLTQLFAPKIHNHDTEYVKLNDERLTNARVASDVHQWAKQRNKPVYNWGEIKNKPEFNYLPLTGGMITPTENNFREGIRIGDKDGWSLVQLGSVNTFGTTENSWTIAKKPNNSFQISNGGISDNIKKGLNLTANSLTFSDNANILLEVTNELVHTNRVFDAPYISIHQSGSDYISLNSKDYKLNVKVGSANRDSGEFKRVLAAGYEIPDGTNTRLLTANGESYGLGIGQKQTINLKGLNENKYYLVYCTVAPSDRVRVRIQNALNYTSKPSWSTHDGGFSLNLEFEQTGNGWGSNNVDLNIIQYNILWTNVEPVMNIGQIGQSNKMYMYLRGGGEYYVYHWSQEGKSDIWANPRKNEGNFEEHGVSIPYCRDWDENLKVVATNIRSYKDGTYGVVTKIDKPLVINEIFLDNYSNSKTNIWTANNELNIGSRNAGGYTKIYCQGYKVNGSDDNHLLLAGGGTIHRKNLVSKVIQVTTPTFDITGDNVGQTAHVATNCVLNYNTMPELSTFAVRKVYDGGSVTFSGSLPPIYTGDTVLNGKKGSTAIIDYGLNNQIFVDIRNI